MAAKRIRSRVFFYLLFISFFSVCIMADPAIANTSQEITKEVKQGVKETKEEIKKMPAELKKAGKEMKKKSEKVKKDVDADIEEGKKNVQSITK